MASNSCSDSPVSASSTQHQSNSQFELLHLLKASLQLQLQDIQHLRAYQTTSSAVTSHTHTHKDNPSLSVPNSFQYVLFRPIRPRVRRLQVGSVPSTLRQRVPYGRNLRHEAYHGDLSSSAKVQDL